MYSTTLRGVFPEPKPVCKRNFIKENVKHIKQMQGILQNSGIFEARPQRQDTNDNKPKKTASYSVTTNNRLRRVGKKKTMSTSSSTFTRTQKVNQRQVIDLNNGKGENAPQLQLPNALQVPPLERLSHRGVQTDKPDEIAKLYETGTIKYPSPSVLEAIAIKKSPKKQDCGDIKGVVVTNPHNEDLTTNMQNLGLGDKHNFIKENIMAIKNKQAKESPSDQNKLLNYQKGVLPKYLRERKEEQMKELEADPECPEGHVLLPEEERKETLRVLRQSYADRIQELNSMPVRNDTLRMRKRKMALEEELKKIDEGIKVFQRPKVFVKINA